MDELEISGKRYISSKRAAKENGYHKDYIGQLIRAGKIQGSKVGRTWYIEVESLNTYLKEQYVELAPRISTEFVAPRALQKIQPSDSYSQKKATPKAQSENRAPIQMGKSVVLESGLKYIDDEEEAPAEKVISIAAPIVENKIRINRQESGTHESLIPKKVTTSKTEKNRRSVFAAGIVGLVAFVSSFGLSYYLHYDTIVEPTNVYTSLHF